MHEKITMKNGERGEEKQHTRATTLNKSTKYLINSISLNTKSLNHSCWLFCCIFPNCCLNVSYNDSIVCKMLKYLIGFFAFCSSISCLHPSDKDWLTDIFLTKLKLVGCSTSFMQPEYHRISQDVVHSVTKVNAWLQDIFISCSTWTAQMTLVDWWILLSFYRTGGWWTDHWRCGKDVFNPLQGCQTLGYFQDRALFCSSKRYPCPTRPDRLRNNLKRSKQWKN